MIYLIQGQEEYFIRKKIAELADPSKGEIVRFQGNDKNWSIEEMLEACDGNSLFSTHTTVLVDQPFFLLRKTDDKLLEGLYRYLEKPLYETDLIFYTLENNFNSKLKAYKKVTENAQVLTLNSYDYKNFASYVRQQISEAQISISPDAVSHLTNVCRRNATLFHQNLEILKLYPGRIDTDLIDRMCTQAHENDSFDMVNALTAGDVSNAISFFSKVNEYSDSIVPSIHQLASQLRFLYFVSWLQSQGKNRNEILEITGVKDYRLKMAIQTLNKIRREQIIELLAKLSDLDVKLKSDSSIPEDMRFELFIMELVRKGIHEID